MVSGGGGGGGGGGGDIYLIPIIHINQFTLFSVILERKTLSYSQINTVPYGTVIG